MKRKLWIVGVLPMLAFSHCTEMYGQTSCHDGELSHLNANGMVSLAGTKVMGDTQVRGQLSAHGATFESIAINGTAELNQVTASKDLVVKGFLVMKQTKACNVIATANRVELYDTEVGELHLVKHQEEPQTVILAGNSRVKGNIKFDQGNGRVVMSPSASVVGKIIGGEKVS